MRNHFLIQFPMPTPRLGGPESLLQSLNIAEVTKCLWACSNGKE